ncbi:MAG: hypothetical protein ACKE51_09275, partial [Methylococcaceae bacterium]
DLLERSRAGDIQANRDMINEFAGFGGIAKVGKLAKGTKSVDAVENIDGIAEAGVKNELLGELSNQGIKHTPENVIDIAKTQEGRIVFLEAGNNSAGLKHIVNKHVDDFIKRGITKDQIPDAVMTAVTKGKIVGHQGAGAGRPIYEFQFNGQTQRIAVTTSNNGFIVGANPN